MIHSCVGVQTQKSLFCIPQSSYKKTLAVRLVFIVNVKKLLNTENFSLCSILRYHALACDISKMREYLEFLYSTLSLN
jgi:hypothetical protein